MRSDKLNHNGLVVIIGEINLDIYCDEINPVKSKYDDTTWMYIGMLFVPKTKKTRLLKHLWDARCIQYNNWHHNEDMCPHQCKYHEKNNTEIHYHEIDRSNARYRIAERWLKEFMIEKNNRGNMGLVYFNLLGLDLTKMDLDEFGPDEGRELTIYNRFFRTTLTSGAKYFFAEYDRINIEKIYHDKGSQEKHDYFPWHAGQKINLDDDKIVISNENVIFVNSDHRLESPDLAEESQFIQFIDVILGSIFCCLHNPTKNVQKQNIGLAIKPLSFRLLNNPQNVNSGYHYHRKQQISFFPRNKLSDDTEISKQLNMLGNMMRGNKSYNQFYNKRPIPLNDKEQRNLFENW